MHDDRRLRHFGVLTRNSQCVCVCVWVGVYGLPFAAANLLVVVVGGGGGLILH